ncbi:MAG: phage virion morphogenesis protein [Pseudomonadota bacterium]
MLKVEFNAKPIIDKLEAAAAVLDDLTPIHQDIGDYMVEATRERFRRGEAPDGSKWLPKSAVTLQRYLARGDGARPDPLIGPSRRLSTEVLSFASRESSETGSNLEYSGVMQDGAAQGAFGRDSRNHPIPWGRIPARVWLGISAKDEIAIVDIVDDHIAEPLGEP